MRSGLFTFFVLICLSAYADSPEISIPDADIALIKSADLVEVTGTNVGGGHEDFSIHNWKAIKQFTDLLTDARFIAVPKTLNPQFKSKARYDVRFSANGQPVFELQVVADTVLDIPNDPSFYMQSSRHSDVLMEPLMKLR